MALNLKFSLQTIFLVPVMVEVVGQAFDDAFSEVLLLGIGVEAFSSLGLEMKPSSSKVAGILVCKRT